MSKNWITQFIITLYGKLCSISIYIRLIWLSLVLITLSPNNALANFIEGPRYKGWYYFEEKPAQSTQNYLTKSQQEHFKRLRAKQNIENLKNTIEEYKYLMLDNPTPENVKKYREQEALMWNKALELDQSWRLANIIYKDLYDPSKDPVNSRAVKLKREQEQREQSLTITEFAKNYSLILFKKSSCPYCAEFEPVLKNFVDKYSFNLETIDLENLHLKPLKYQEDISIIIQKLDIQTVPIVIAVDANSTDAFELSRGYLSIPELEEYAHLMYLFKNEVNR